MKRFLPGLLGGVLIFNSAFSFSSIPPPFSGVGFSEQSEALAKESARSDLASQIFVRVQSQSKVYLNKKGENFFTGSTQSHTDLPLMGVKIRCEKRRRKQDHQCTATMDVAKSSGLYHQQLASLQRKINSQYDKLSKLPPPQHHDVISQLLLDYEQHEKFLTVITYLEGKTANRYSLTPTKADLLQRLAQLEQAVPSLELAAKLLRKQFNQSNIYIRPLLLDGSQVVTPFARALADRMSEHFITVSDITHADYLLVGRYQVDKSSLLVTYRLQDKQGEILSSKTLELAPSSYKNYQVKPLNPNFDQMLTNGYAETNDLRVDVGTTKGQHGLAFSSDDSISVWVKLNNPGYFYIAGHSKNTTSELSYLLGLYEDSYDRPEQIDNSRFLKYIGPEQVNKKIEVISGFVPCPPYGEESLQVIASNDRSSLMNAIPQAPWDDALGYFVVSHNRLQGMIATRGIKPKPNKKKQLQSSEAVMTFTTYKGRSDQHCR